MPIEIKYTGTQQRWPELATTGKQSVWMPGQIEERDDVEAGKLLATGLFKTEPVALTATLSAQGIANVAVSYEMPGFDPSVVPALVANSTAAQVGDVVTVTCPSAHNIPAAANGMRAYFPGSASIPAGWYPGFAYISTTAFSFSRPSATVASESINSGAAFTSSVLLASMQLDGGLLGKRGVLKLKMMVGCDTTAAIKYQRLYLGAAYAETYLTTFGSCEQAITIRNVNSESIQRVATMRDGTSPSAFNSAAIDTTVAQTVQFIVQNSAAGAAQVIYGAELEILSKR